MKNIKHYTRSVCMYILLCTSAIIMAADPLGPDDAYTWSILNDQLAISPGSVITNAVLTLHHVSAAGTTGNETLYIHLLDNPDMGVERYIDGQPGNYFEGYGVYLTQISQSELSTTPTDIVIDLSQINDDNSFVWSVFERPFKVTLGDTSQISLSSALLSLLDYAGTGPSFGFGLDCDGFTLEGLSLELTIQSMTDVVPSSTLSFSYGNTSPYVSNQAPSINAITDKIIVAGNTLAFTVQADDPDGDAVSIFVGNAPAGASWANNVFTWTPSASQVGSYDILFSAEDGNGGQDSTIMKVTVSSAAAQWTILAYDDFESGWGHYTDGGADCLFYTRTKYAPQGSKAACIRDGSGTASSFALTNGFDIKTPGYSEMKITFSYMAVSMDNSSEGFRLDYWDGTKWLTLKSWRKSINFKNASVYSETVAISNSTVAFSTNMKIRFVCQASDNVDMIMIDKINISAR